jgi:transcriptional regulator with XRE-family HTH domain
MGSAGAEREGEVVWSTRLGSHLEASRIRAGLRRVDLARRLDVSEETIRLWERGAVQPTADRLARLIAMLAIEGSLWHDHDALRVPSADELPLLARRLLAERQDLGLPQAALATRLGVAQSTYAGWETGRSSPGAQYLPVLAELFGTAVEEIAALCEAPFVVERSEWPPFGQAVGAGREVLRLSRADLAARLGVSTRTIASWELGYRRPHPRQVAALAAVLSLDASALAGALPPRTAASRLGDLILSRQQELGLRSTDVARLVGTTEPTLSRWINGRSRPQTKNLRRLAEVLQLPHALVTDA